MCHTVHHPESSTKAITVYASRTCPWTPRDICHVFMYHHHLLSYVVTCSKINRTLGFLLRGTWRLDMYPPKCERTGHSSTIVTIYKTVWGPDSSQVLSRPWLAFPDFNSNTITNFQFKYIAFLDFNSNTITNFQFKYKYTAILFKYDSVTLPFLKFDSNTRPMLPLYFMCIIQGGILSLAWLTAVD